MIEKITNLDEVMKVSDDDDWELSEFEPDPVRNIFPLKNQTESAPKKVQEAEPKVVDSKAEATRKKEPDGPLVGL